MDIGSKEEERKSHVYIDKTKMHSWGCATRDGVCANASNYTNKKCYCKETERNSRSSSLEVARCRARWMCRL